MKKGKKILIGVTGALAAGIIGGIGIIKFIDSQVEHVSLYAVPKGYYSEVQSYNVQFTPYEGSKMSSEQIRSLISTINASNVSNSEHFVQYTGPEISELEKEYTYSVELKFNNEGYVCEVIVKQNEINNSTTE